jgi:outer membrane protein assembly factor BamE (lipoprotein component of BamABCDE complex)
MFPGGIKHMRCKYIIDFMKTITHHDGSIKKAVTDSAIRFLTLAVIIAMFGYGCITIGSNFQSNDFSWIINGRTQKNDIYNRLGEPFRMGVDEGKLTWTYGFYKYRTIGTTATKDLVVYFNKDGTVSSYTFNTSFPDEKEKWRDRVEP